MPDQNDAHILAAAIRCNADVIVTANIRDFPIEYLRQFDVDAQHPDFFLSNLVELNPESALLAFKNQVNNLRKPPMQISAVLDIFKKVGLESTSNRLEKLL